MPCPQVLPGGPRAPNNHFRVPTTSWHPPPPDLEGSSRTAGDLKGPGFAAQGQRASAAYWGGDGVAHGPGRASQGPAACCEGQGGLPCLQTAAGVGCSLDLRTDVYKNGNNKNSSNKSPSP